jgi:hypothetical protein
MSPATTVIDPREENLRRSVQDASGAAAAAAAAASCTSA